MKRLCGFILSFVWIIISIQAKETTLVIYSTNDMHGSINNFAKIAKFLKKNPGVSNREISRQLGEGFSTDTVNRAIKKINADKQAAIEKSKTSRDEVVGIVPTDTPLSERLVNQVVKPLGFLVSGGFS